MAARYKSYLPFVFIFAGCIFIFLSWHGPLGDFGNYYYGSRLLVDGKFSNQVYTDIAVFNRLIASYGETNFFENYIPVPPFSAVFYLPFTIFNSLHAKLIFNAAGLILFSLSLHRLLAFLKISTPYIFTLPFVFLYPLYSNIAQGQTYLVIFALLSEAYISSQKGKLFFPALLIAIALSLKLFPAFLLFYFLLKKNFRVAGLILAFSIVLNLTAFVVLPENTVSYYFSDVLPRLIQNDVVGTYYYGNQSVYTFLLTLFSQDTLSNPHPLVNNPLAVVLGESLFFSLAISLLICLRKQPGSILYPVVLFASVVLGRYNTSYGMILLMPLFINLFSLQLKSPLLLLVFMCACVTLNTPTGSLMHQPILIKFARLWGLLALLVFLLVLFRSEFRLKLLVSVFIPVVIFKYLSFTMKPFDYFGIQNTSGILFDLQIKPDTLILRSTMGDRELTERFRLDRTGFVSPDLIIDKNILYYKNKAISSTRDNKRNAFMYGDSVIFMSDLNQAVGCFKLRRVFLNE